MQKSFFALPIALAVIVCCGCTGENRPPGLPPLHPVTITFTVDGKPLDNALVLLHHENDAISHWTVGSYTDADGVAIIVTHGQFRGAPAGKYKVCVTKSVIQETVAQVTSTMQPKLIQLVHSKFGDPKTTPLEVNIPESKKLLHLTLEVHKP